MRHMQLVRLVSASAIGVAALATMPAAAETKLVIGSWGPPGHHLNADVLPTLGKWIQESTSGRVTFEIKYNLAVPQRQFDAVKDGAQDVGWTFHGYDSVRFVAAQVMELPLLGAGPEAGSAAYWRIHEKHLAKADEHKGVVVIGLMTHGPGVIHAQKPIKSWADLKGMKIRFPGGVASRIGAAFGAVAVAVPAQTIREALGGKEVEAVFMPAEAQKSFRLGEVAKYILRAPGGLYGGSFAIVVNPKKLEALSAADQAAIRAATGEKLSAYAGAKWAAADRAGYEAAKPAGVEVSEASPKMTEELAKVTAVLEADWIKRASGKGYDPATALRELRETARALDKK